MVDVLLTTIDSEDELAKTISAQAVGRREDNDGEATKRMKGTTTTANTLTIFESLSLRCLLFLDC
jgi:hypothetical protein